MESNVYYTKGIEQACLTDAEFFILILKNIGRFEEHDWGDTCPEDAKLNNKALKTKDRIVALYKTDKGNTFIIKDANDGPTTVMFANEY